MRTKSYSINLAIELMNESKILKIEVSISLKLTNIINIINIIIIISIINIYYK